MTAPKTVVSTQRDLSQLVESLIKQGLVDDQNFPVVRQLSGNRWEVVFKGAEMVSLAMRNIDYQVLYRELNNRRAFSVRFIDGGLLQLLYQFDNNLLMKHRLAFYPSPNLPPFPQDPDAYIHDERFIDIVARRIVPLSLRFDYDGQVAGGLAHSACHLTLGDIEACRIPVSAPLSPRWFIDFILRHFYQTEGHSFVSTPSAHMVTFATTLTEAESDLMHVVVPYRART